MYETVSYGCLVIDIPRSRMTPERQAELFDVVIDLVREVGYEGLTLDAVAARAKTSKATLYRQWQGKPGLVVAALQCHKPHVEPPPPAASLAEDLELLARDAENHDDAGQDVKLTYGLMHAAATDEAFGAAVRETFLEPALAGIADIFSRASARGEIADDPQLFRELATSLASRYLFALHFGGDTGIVEGGRRHVDLIIKPLLGLKPTFTEQL